MNTESLKEKYKHLYYLFTCYFHQDWDLDSQTVRSVIIDYIDEHSVSELFDILLEIQELRITDPSKQRLKHQHMKDRRSFHL